MELAAKKYSFEKEFLISREAAWKLVSDNDRMNQNIGLFPVKFSGAKIEDEGVFFREASAKVAGIIPLRWQEYPFQWEENKKYVVERRYYDGPLKSYTWGVELLDNPDGDDNKTIIRAFAEFIPRNVLGYGAISLIGVQSLKNTLAYVEKFVKTGADLARIPDKQKEYKVKAPELERLERSLKNWPVEEQYVELLHAYLIEKRDHDVAHIKPVQLARQWKADPDEVLRVLLYATKTGILDLSWNLICPNCRVSKTEYKSLAQLTPQFHCDLCGINYDANFDQYVELLFSVHPSVRKAYAEEYCVGAPQITPHVKVQKVMAKGETIVLNMPLSADSLRLRVLQKNAIVSIDPKLSGKAAKAALEYSDEGWSSETIGEAGEIRIANSSSTDIVLVVEQSTWNTETVTAAKVTAMPEFRELFSSEVLAPGQKIGVGHVTILFTDLKNSTVLYETVGDANAYSQVKRHFEFLEKWIAKNSGSVVKTIGDAVMAVFHLPEDGLNAAIQIQQSLETFNQEATEDIELKIGLYSGPAIAVNSNDLLDYFGRTVNIAARIEAQGTGRDIVFSQEYMDQDGLKEIIENSKMDVLPFEANLKGIEGSMKLMRLTPREVQAEKLPVVSLEMIG
ncbi:adenylate/guanylate cyclase domain-containing protein [Planococcus sp. YIM B11945]|uniref:adenylate/guanylate cyclase domain-containing protein n=1 Tax=Planococcus sp. YIM B11945 TaxID=3435410 RepID=UPI003D7E512D